MFVMLLGKVASLAWKLLIVQLGPATLGTTQLILTALTILSSFSLFGMQTSLGRFASIAWRQRRPQRAQQFLLTSLRWGGLLGLALAVACWLGPDLTKSLLKLPAVATQDLQALGVAVPFMVFSELAWSYLAAQRHILRYGLTRYLSLPLARLALLFGLMQLGLPITQLIIWHLVGAVVVTTVMTWLVGALPVSFSWRPLPQKVSRQFLNYTVSIGSSFVLFMVYSSADVLLLNHFGTLEQVGLLSALLIFTELIDVFFTGFLNLFQSFLSTFHRDPWTGLKFTMVTASSLLMGGLGLVGGLTLFREPLITLFLGPEYQVIGQLVGLALILKTVESSVVFSLHHFLDFYGYVKATIGLMLVGLIIKVSLGWWLIPRFALAGVYYTQAATIFFEVVGCVVLIGLVVLNRNHRWSFMRRWLKLD